MSRDLVGWSTKSIKLRMETLEADISDIERKMAYASGYELKRLKATHKGVSTRYSEMEHQLSKRMW